MCPNAGLIKTTLYESSFILTILGLFPSGVRASTAYTLGLGLGFSYCLGSGVQDIPGSARL